MRGLSRVRLIDRTWLSLSTEVVLGFIRSSLAAGVAGSQNGFEEGGLVELKRFKTLVKEGQVGGISHLAFTNQKSLSKKVEHRAQQTRLYAPVAARNFCSRPLSSITSTNGTRTSGSHSSLCFSSSFKLSCF